MLKKSPVEMERLRIVKTLRTIVRLKHSLKADEELNKILPDTLSQFDKAIQGGELLRLNEGVSDILKDE